MQTSPFTTEHDALRDSVRRWVEAELVPNLDAWEEAGWFPDEVFRSAGAQGFFGLALPTDVGGQGADVWANIVWLEEISKASGSLAMALSVQSDMACPPIAQFGTRDQIERYLKPALRGEKIGAIGITEPEAGSDVAGITTRAERDGDHWILNGAKMYITNGLRADWVTMVVRTSPAVDGDRWSGISMFLVDTDLEGFSVSKKLDKVGMRTSDTALLFMDDVRVPHENLLGTEGQGFAQIMWELQGERIAVGIQAVAGAGQIVEDAMAYAKQREAFGRPIANFQAVKHRLVEMATDVEANRAFAYACADKWNRGEYAVTDVAILKLMTAQMSFAVADASLQIHGGYGYTQGARIERAWRDARLGRIGGGADEVQREVISKLMGV